MNTCYLCGKEIVIPYRVPLTRKWFHHRNPGSLSNIEIIPWLDGRIKLVTMKTEKRKVVLCETCFSHPSKEVI